MRALAHQFEEAFRQLGVRLGHELAAKLTVGDTVAPRPRNLQRRIGEQGQSLRTAKILPGLTGRRRRPGEQPPMCGRFGCDRLSRTRGYCQTHYVQWLKAGGGRSLG